MKKLLVLNMMIIFFLLSLNCYSQKPEKVYSLVKQYKPVEWYKTQIILWKKEIDKNPKNTDAWLNYYTANRMLKFTDFSNWENDKGKNSVLDLDSIISLAQKAIPNTFEAYYIRYYNSGSHDKDSHRDLLKAYELEPDRPEIMDDMVLYYEEEGDTTNMEKFCKKWYESGDCSASILNWNYNVLVSLDSNAIIITGGDNDTYPLWILQYAFGIRKDVGVFNISLNYLDDYRDKLYKKYGIKHFDFDYEKIKSEKDYNKAMMSQLINHIIKNSKDRPVYITLTLQPDFYSEFKDSIYMIGLALKYSDKDFDNIAYIKRNFEKNYLLDYLKMPFYNDMSKDISNNISTNYLPVLMKLYQHYKISGDLTKMQELKNLAEKIIKDANSDRKILDYFN